METLTQEKLIALVTSGVSLIPITEGEKKPHSVLGKSHDLLKRRSTIEEVKAWSNAGITSWATAGGAVSDNLVVLDFDEKHYEGLYDLWYARLADDQKAIVAQSFLNSTRNNGKHLRYRTETPQPTTKLAHRVEFNKETGEGKIVTTAETKAEGGYALVPPSSGYTVIHGDLNNLPLVTDEMHEELIDILRTFNEVEDAPATEYEWKPSGNATGDRPGDRLNALMSWNEILEPNGWVEESKNHWRRPGKKEGEGISATTEWNEYPVFYVFSSAASPFAQNKGYSKFHVFALLSYGGDFKAAAKKAAELYPQGENARGTTQSKLLVELIASNPDATLFLDQYKDAHVRFRRGDHFEVWPCDSTDLRHWLADEYYRATNGSVPSAQAISNALNVLGGRARAGGLQHDLHTRIAEFEGAYWYDLCDEKWRTVRIDKSGWSIVSDPPILFRRHTYQKEQVVPVPGGDIHEVLDFVNVKDDGQQRLLLAHLVVTFIPGFPHAILYVHGPAGSAKTTLLDVHHELTDPSRIGSLSLPRNPEELKQQLNHHSAFASFDNVSKISDESSDLLCRAVTGAGFSKRRLYTNDEDFIYEVQANIAINGINLGCYYQDLLDRSLLMELSRVQPEDRREVQELWNAFMSAKGRIMGAIFDALVKAINIKPGVKPETLHRMGDYIAWGCAITEALEDSQNAYLAAFQKNVDGQNESVLDAYDEAILLFRLMEKQDRWEGTATALLGEFKTLGEDLFIDAKDLPKNGQGLSRQLNILKPALEAAGYHISPSTSGKERTIIIRKEQQPSGRLAESDEETTLSNNHFPTENPQPEG